MNKIILEIDSLEIKDLITTINVTKKELKEIRRKTVGKYFGEGDNFVIDYYKKENLTKRAKKLYKMRLINKEKGLILFTKDLTKKEFTTIKEKLWKNTECQNAEYYWKSWIYTNHTNGDFTIGVNKYDY